MTLRTTFESAEHSALLQIALPGLDTKSITLANGFSIPFSTIIALAGDYYALPNEPISTGKDDAERRSRFKRAYNSLAFADKKELQHILGIIDKQRKLINDAMERGEAEYIAVKKYSFEELVKATFYTKCRFVKISEKNFDHFEENALIAHQTGHQLAKEAAALAHGMKNPHDIKKQLAYAYSLEAFGMHFLTDLFATGHIRTPRYPLFRHCGQKSGGLLALFMHGEDNYIGLNVTNKIYEKDYLKRKEKDPNATLFTWKAYGDAHLFEPYNQKTKEIVVTALKKALSEVHQAYETGIADTKPSVAYDYLPYTVGDANSFPMFIHDKFNDHILYRKDVDNIYCNEYKKLTSCKTLSIIVHFLKLYIKDLIITPDELHKFTQEADDIAKHNFKTEKKSSTFFKFWRTKNPDVTSETNQSLTPKR